MGDEVLQRTDIFTHKTPSAQYLTSRAPARTSLLHARDDFWLQCALQQVTHRLVAVPDDHHRPVQFRARLFGHFQRVKSQFSFLWHSATVVQRRLHHAQAHHVRQLHVQAVLALLRPHAQKRVQGALVVGIAVKGHLRLPRHVVPAAAGDDPQLGRVTAQRLHRLDGMAAALDGRLHRQAGSWRQSRTFDAKAS